MNACKILAASFIMWSTSASAREVLLEAKGAYYFATNHLFRQIYGHGSGRYGAEATIELCDELYAFVSIDGFTKKGRSLGGCSPTRLTMIPVSFGLKYLHEICWGDVYLGLGGLATHVSETDCAQFVIPKRHDWTMGGILKAGIIFDLPRCFFIDLFADYSFIKINFNNCSCLFNVQSCRADISGVAVGLGVGYRF